MQPLGNNCSKHTNSLHSSAVAYIHGHGPTLGSRRHQAICRGAVRAQCLYQGYTSNTLPRHAARDRQRSSQPLSNALLSESCFLIHAARRRASLNLHGFMQVYSLKLIHLEPPVSRCFGSQLPTTLHAISVE
jgi:hypothetical protein